MCKMKSFGFGTTSPILKSISTGHVPALYGSDSLGRLNGFKRTWWRDEKSLQDFFTSKV